MTFDDIIEQSVGTSPVLAALREATAACAPYSTNALALLAHSPQERPSVPLPAPAAEVRGLQITAWRCYQASFMDLMQSLLDCPDRKKWNTVRTAEQVVGIDTTGAEVVLTPEDIRAMPINTAKTILQCVNLMGDMPCSGKPEVISKGDAISKPMVVRLGEGHRVVFDAATLGELEELGAEGDMVDQIEALFALTEDPDLLWELAPADGWFILEHVHKPLHTAAKKALKGVRSFEYALKMQFDPSTSLRVIHARQFDYGAFHDKRIKAQEAAASKAKRRGRR